MPTLFLSLFLFLLERSESTLGDITTFVDYYKNENEKLGENRFERHRSSSFEKADLTDRFVYPLRFVRWIECKQEWRGVVTNDSFARIRAVTVKTTRSITCSRRTPEGETRHEGRKEPRGNIIQRLGSRFSIGNLYLAKLLASEKDESRLLSPAIPYHRLFPSFRDRATRKTERKKKRRRRRLVPREIAYARKMKKEIEIEKSTLSIRCILFSHPSLRSKINRNIRFDLSGRIRSFRF